MFASFLSAIVLGTLAETSIGENDLGEPTGNVILTISGNVEVTNKENTAELDFALLQKFRTETFTTTTIWTNGADKFEGVPLSVLIEELGLEGTTLRASAINDYTVEIPFSDAVENGPIVAYLMNDQRMSVRNKGPLWIVYPYDSAIEYRSEVIYSRSIWQLDRIEALD